MSRKSLNHGEALCSGDNAVTSDAHEIEDNYNDGDDDDGLDVSRADDGLDVMTGNHVLPELSGVCPGPSTVTTVTRSSSQDTVMPVPGSRPSKKQTSCSRFLSFSLTQVKKDIRFHEPVESSFSHQVLLLNDSARGSATLSHIKSMRCQIKSREWVKKRQGFLILMKEQCWDQRLRKLTIRGRKTLIMIVSAGLDHYSVPGF